MIYYDKDSKCFHLQTKNTSYIFCVEYGDYLIHLYYGKKIAKEDDISYFKKCEIRSFAPYPEKTGNVFSLDTALQEYSYFGSGDFRSSALKIKNSKGNSITLFKYQDHEIYKGREEINGLPFSRADKDTCTLCVRLYDKISDCILKLYYSVFEESDIICRHAEIENCGKFPVYLEQAASAMFDFHNEKYEIHHLSGGYAREHQLAETKLTKAKFEISSKRGHSGHDTNPFFIFATEDTNTEFGDCYGFSLLYSGNFKMTAESDQYGSVRILAGINDDTFEWKLDPYEKFACPELISTFSSQGEDKISLNFSDHIREHILPEKFAYAKRPVVINTWEACFFDIDESKLLEFGKIASQIGIDMLVIDDGWFGKRNNDHRGLGDWVVNNEKFQGGLKSFVRKLNNMGLNAGIWIEPEMVNPDSELYKKHPEWCLGCRNIDKSLSRNQLVLDMSNKEVVDYIFQSLNSCLFESGVKYIKWDMNRSLSEVASDFLDSDRQGEVFHRYMLGVYRLHKLMTEAFPDVLFEGCSGGGGRFDAGMLFYVPQIWVSDNTDPYSRAAIQCGTTYGYPLSSISCHISKTPNMGTGRLSTMEFRYHMSLAGILGYELNLLELSEKDKEEIRKNIEEYKNIQELILRGDFYRLIPPFEEKEYAVNIVSKDKTEVVFVYMKLSGTANPPQRVVKLKGLNPDIKYCDNDIKLSGRTLMSAGLLLPAIYGEGLSIIKHFKMIEK